MDEKKHYIEYIENNPLVKAGLEKVEDQEQRKRIMLLTKAYAEQIADVFAPLVKRLQEDEEFRNDLRKQAKKQKSNIHMYKKED